jgi:TRAP-type C4-dicarboxylate transport system substrate-binding protein
MGGIMKKNRYFALMICFVFIFFVVGAMSVNAADKVITLKGITPWQADYDLCKAFFNFQELVHKKSKGKLQVTYLGGPEVAPPFEQVEALRNGVVDVILAAAAYYRPQVPEAECIMLTKLPPSKLRTSGFYDKMREYHLKRANVIYLANTAGVNKFRLYSNTYIDKPDLSGIKFRVSPVYVPLVEGLKGTPIMMKPAEVYTALERGVVDGYGWTYLGIMDFGWQEVTKYVIDHPFYALDGSILINADVYNKLPKDMQNMLEEIGVELEVMTEKFIGERMASEDQRLKDAGLKFIKFSDQDGKKFVQTAYDEGWKVFYKKFPEIGPQLRKLGE